MCWPSPPPACAPAPLRRRAAPCPRPVVDGTWSAAPWSVEVVVGLGLNCPITTLTVEPLLTLVPAAGFWLCTMPFWCTVGHRHGAEAPDQPGRLQGGGAPGAWVSLVRSGR